MNKFRIVIIGAGETGTPLLKQLLAANFVELQGVCDLDLSRPGIQLAKEHGVAVSNDFLELLKKQQEIDIIIEVTGAPAVRETLRKHMMDNNNHHTLIVHERIALLMMSLSAGKAVSGKHADLEYN